MNLGFLLPLIIFAVLFVIIKLIGARDGGEKDYDERQAMIRGRAAHYGYLTTLVLLMPALLVYGGKGTDTAYVLTSLAFFGGLGVNAVYNIWNGGFFHLHQNASRYTILCFFIAGLNFLTTGLRLAGGQGLWEILTDRAGTNMLLGILFAVVGVTVLLRQAADRREEE